MQTRLRGAAHDWYDNLDNYEATWVLWKKKLLKAFPRSSDFVERLEVMLALVKSSNEAMTRCYRDVSYKKVKMQFHALFVTYPVS